MADPTRINSPSRETSGADDVIFQEAVDALRGGNKARARELLTGLIKNDQNNVEYWIWLSGAMETPKERIAASRQRSNWTLKMPQPNEA